MTIEIPLADIQVVQYEKGTCEFIATLITSDAIPEDLLRKAAPTIVNKEIRWAHLKPEEEPDAFLGNWKGAQFVEGNGTPARVKVRGVILGWTPAQLKAQEIIRTKKSEVGISAGLVKFFDEKGELVDVHFREGSLTFHPAVEGCRVETVLNQGKNKDGSEMSAEDKIVAAPDLTSRLILKANEDLQRQLTEEKAVSEQLASQLSANTTEYEEKISVLQGEKTKLAEEKASTEAKVQELQAKIATFSRKPKLDKILEVEGVKEEGKAARLEELSKLSDETLDALIGQGEKMKAAKVATNDDVAGTGNKPAGYDDMAPEDVAKKLNPNLFDDKGNLVV